MQHQNKHTCNIRRKNRRNIGDRRLQDKCTIIATYATSRSTFATCIRNPCNIPLKQLKHSKHTLATHAFQCNVALLLGRMLLVLVELDADMGARCHGVLGGHRCRARRRHGPRQWPWLADGARPRREARVRMMGQRGRTDEQCRQSPSHERVRHWRAESVPRWRAARASGVIPRARAHNVEARMSA